MRYDDGRGLGGGRRERRRRRKEERRREEAGEGARAAGASLRFLCSTKLHIALYSKPLF